MEHSAILSTFIKLPFVIKIFVSSIFEWPFYTGFVVHVNSVYFYAPILAPSWIYFYLNFIFFHYNCLIAYNVLRLIFGLVLLIYLAFNGTFPTFAYFCSHFSSHY